MGRKRSLEELEAAAKAAEQRAKELRAQAKKVTEAEEAKVNAELIKAIREWLNSFPEYKRKKWEDLPDYFRERARRNIVMHDPNSSEEEAEPVDAVEWEIANGNMAI